MCGIIGYTGPRQAQQILLEGLLALEYRGYDSAGIAVINTDKIEIVKKKGKVAELIEACQELQLEGTCGIGHTRWATHGKPSDYNSHPHSDCTGNFALIHNGIIENYQELKAGLLERGHKFKSETDTEVIVHLIEEAYQGDLAAAARQVAQQLQGAYALAIVSVFEPEKIVVVRQETPLVIGLGDGEHILASDPAALVAYTKKMWRLNNGEMGVLTPEYAQVLDIETGKPVEKQVIEISWDITEAKKGGFAHFMRKEIEEQPHVVNNAMLGRLQRDGTVTLSELDSLSDKLKRADRIHIVAMGTSYYAGLVGKYIIEEVAKIPVEVSLASDFRYRKPLIDERSVVIAISQSGETLDTLAAVRLAQQCGASVIGLVNVVGSSIAVESDEVIYLQAGPEIGVASTKAYVSQLVVLNLLGLYLAQLRGVAVAEREIWAQGMFGLSHYVGAMLEQEPVIQDVAEMIADKQNAFFIGRLLDSAVAMEGALKLKEISYIHAESTDAGQLKHGPLALITEGVAIVALATQHEVLDKMISNVMEVQARGGEILLLTDSIEECRLEKQPAAVIEIPKVHKWLAPIVTVVPLQLLAYHAAVMRGNNPDKPRNLAKSVTVE